MPLRDHFHSPVDDRHRWEGFHTGWPMMLGARLRSRLPPRCLAEPYVHSGSSAEIDVATFEDEETWAPARPSLAIATDLPSQDEYAIRIRDMRRHQRLVAAVELVSPGNKDRAEAVRAFVVKCAAMLREQVCVAIVDVVTSRAGNLYAELLDEIGLEDPALAPEPPPLYAVACRLRLLPDSTWHLESWLHPLALGAALPTLPWWLAQDLAVPLELEESYEQSCAILGIP